MPCTNSLCLFRNFKTNCRSKLFQDFTIDLGVNHKSAPLRPTALLDCIRAAKNTDLLLGAQEDSQEFLAYFLDQMHEEFLRNQSILQWHFSEPVLARVEKEDEAGWLEVGQKQKKSETRTMARIETPISFLFSGQFRSSLKRPGVKDSITFEPFNCLQVQVEHRMIGSLEEGLAFLSRPESIEGGLTKRICLDILPKVLVIQLKRFVFNQRSMKIEKVSKYVTYPERLVIDKALYPTKGNQPTYRLFAVVSHHGRHAGGGHYTAEVRKSFQHDEHWQRMNDSNITKVTLEQVLAEKSDSTPYLLFYQKTKDLKHPL